ncbi:MAG: hypothetical protein QOE92_2550 [Chloroflexota bacterium]|jgi:undecaprenyl-diphosphatase|nr:hypothetical protein [Chloroflexota bacterium]
MSKAEAGPPSEADAAQVVQEVGAGRPGPASRRWLGWVSLVSLLAFALDAYLVLNFKLLDVFDVPVELAVQGFHWGPIEPLMIASNDSGGLPQVLIGVAVIVAMFFVDRRSGFLTALGSGASLLDYFVKVSVSRGRPTADLVHILDPSTGFSFASGHAVFYTWVAFMVAFALAPRVRPRWRPLLWLAAAALVFIVCVGRVWAGAHWPSDVLGGVVLALGWCAFVLWLPERWLPAPSWSWVRGRRATARP